MLTVGSLFSGIGGLELGLEMTGRFKTIWQVEKDDFCRKVLAKHWPEVERYDDITTLDGHGMERPDLICGGFPCQNISNAGKREGITGEKSSLWKEMFRLICEVRPRYVLVENVSALVNRGLSVVLGDLAEAGYDAEWACIRASDVGAPHQRERIFIVANSNGNRRWIRTNQQEYEQQCEGTPNACPHGTQEPLAHANGQRCEECDIATSGNESGFIARGVATANVAYASSSRCEEFTGSERACNRFDAPSSRTTQSSMGGVLDGTTGRLDRHRGYEHQWPARPGEQQYDWEPPRVTMSRQPHQNTRLRALGNAVVPQVAQQIGYYILNLANNQE